MNKRELLENELMDCRRAEWTAGVDWRRMALHGWWMHGIEWLRMASMDGWRRMASSGRRMTQEDIDVEVPLVSMVMASSGNVRHKRALTWKSLWCPSRDEPAHRCSLSDTQHATSCFRLCFSHGRDYCDSFSHGCAVVSLT